MTVSSTVRTAGPYIGVGTLTTYAFGFKVFTTTDLLVQVTTAGELDDLVYGSDYTVTLNADQNATPGGNVVLAVPLALGASMTIGSILEQTQPTRLTNAGGFYPQTIEDALDRCVMLIQQATGNVSGAIRVPEIGGVPTLPQASERAGFLLGFNGAGDAVPVAPVSGTAADLALQLAATHGAALVSFLQALTGAILINLEDNERQVVHAIQFGVKVTNTAAQNAAPLQAFFDACSSDIQSAAPEAVLPYGVVLADPPPICRKQFLNLRGHGKNQSAIVYPGATASAITTASMTYFRPCFRDFGVYATSSTGHAIDLSNVTGQVYDGEFRNLNLASGGNALHIPGTVSSHVHSFIFDGIRASSTAGHSFLANMGPAVAWRSCYAVRAGTGKCGYRMAGEILLDGCNGVDIVGGVTTGTWAVFGSNTAATDGYQNDFNFTDLPRVTMIGCNVEAFKVEGFRIHNSHRRFLFEGGKIDRSAFAGDSYTAIITICTQGVDINNPIRLNPSFYIAGSGTPANGDGSQIWVKNGSVCVVDESGIINQVFDSTVAGGTLVPTVQLGAAQDVFGGRALNVNAMQAARASIGVLRFSPGNLTPSGSGLVIDVTGFTKVLITPPVASSISKATFSTTTGADADNGRNGYLLIEAGNANLTIKHNGTSAADGFWMKSHADDTLVPGEIRTFLRSTTANFWWEV